MKDLTYHEVKGIFERLFISPITGAYPLEKEYYMLFGMLTEEDLVEMVELAKRCKKYEDAFQKSSSKFSWKLNHARQYRELREEFVGRLHEFNKNRDCKGTTKKIYDIETLEEIGKSFQIEHAKTLRTYTNKKSCCKWVCSGETITINGILLSDGLFYIGDYFKIPQSYKVITAFDFQLRKYRERNRDYKLSKIYGTVIHDDLPISKGNLKIIPFSSYLDMHPTHRYEYLQWLSGKLTVSEVSTETFLFYLYGLQLRMFIDDSTTEEDRLEIVKHSIVLYTQCQREGIDCYELIRFIDATLSRFFTNGLDLFVPNELLPQLQLYREAIITNSRNNNGNSIMENICRNVMCILNYNKAIPDYLLTDSFYVQFADMVESELLKMSYKNNWEELQKVITNPESFNHYELYCINSPQDYSLLLYDYIFSFQLFPNIYSLGFFNQCINNCFKRIANRISEYNILVSELPSQTSSAISLFDIDYQNIHTKIHRIISEDEEFATIEKETGVTEYTIDKAPIANNLQVLLNDERLTKVEKQTKQAQELLSDIFDENNEETDSAIQKNNVLLDILKTLLTKESWTRKDVEILCQKHHLMIGSVLERINDYSYSRIEDAVIEDDGDTIYVMTGYKDKLI